MQKFICLTFCLVVTVLCFSQRVYLHLPDTTAVKLDSNGKADSGAIRDEGNLRTINSSSQLSDSSEITNTQLLSFNNTWEDQQKHPEMLYRKKAKNFWTSLVITFILIWSVGIYLLRNTSLCKDLSFDPKTNLLRPMCERTYSYARVQLLWWTLIILSCFVSFYFFTGFLAAFTPSMVLLLGGGLAVALFGNMIDNTQIEQNSQSKSVDTAASPSSVPIRHQDLKPKKGIFEDILSDEGGISIHRFQAVVFNVVFGLGFITAFISNLKDLVFPFVNFEQWQLTLLGVSAASYLGFKTNENSTGTKLERQIEASTDPAPPTPRSISDSSTVAPSSAFIGLQTSLRSAGLIQK